MKNALILFLLALSLLFVVPITKVEAYSRVGGYYRRSGSYIQPHFRSNSNSFKWDNYSSRGNTNPWTGMRGYKNW